MGDGNKINLGTHGASYSGNLWQHSNAPIRKSVLGCHAHSEHKDLFLDEKIPTVAEVSTFKMAPIYKEGADNFGYDDLPGWAQVVHDVGEVALYINPLMWPFLLAGCEESTYEQGAATFYYVGDMPVEVTAADVTPDSQDIGPDVVIDVDGGKKDIPIDIKFGCPTPVERDCTVEGMEGDCASGVEYCTEDAFGNPSWSECESKNTEPEKCDSLDNDCDGETDEDFDLEIPCSDGQGECFAGGVTVCNEAGDDVVCNVLPGASKVEICDNLDNDCDGLTDEDFSLGESCSDGEGECYAEGETTCNELGDGVACSAVKGEQADEICDNLDNDCDSFTDEAPNNAEALTQACIPPGSSAECENGSQVCEEGGLWSPCEPTGLTEEVCDGLDNDCNGETDEAYEDLGDLCTVGVGICENEGEKVCAVDHESTICDVEPLPALPEELCNYLDDTCDGETDEGFDLWSTCSVGHGPCETEGAKVCTADGETTECNAVPDLTQASNELCDNVDDDCDGIIDNVSTLGDLCTKGAGICFSEGVLVCTPDSLVPTCNAFDIPPQEEVCDGLDNNCDGDTDNVLGLGEACDNGLQGACLKEGEMVCDGDDLVCDAPLILSEAETCQNFGTDDNCDGILDNVIGLGDLCDNGLQGACFDAGEMVCSGGILVCSASIKEGVQETCGNMGVDNDCDGALDNVPGLDDECDNDLSGACFATGLMVCVGDELKCDAPLLEGAAETCANMGVDNDCDGEEDNIPGEFDDCNNGLFGNCLAQGVMVCVGDDLSCNAAIPEPENETCSNLGFDNDCDGIVDNIPNFGDSCEIGLGICVSPGNLHCNIITGELECDAVEIPPQLEVCNGLDDDCDGEVDNGLTAPLVDKQDGVCFEEVKSCDGQGGWVNNFSAIESFEEIESSCDNLDNDCDGSVDEGLSDIDDDGICDDKDDDVDGDDVLNVDDNCEVIANPGQEDMDTDDIGDLCDDDMDGDTVPNTTDNCPAVANGDQADMDSDNVGDLCDDDMDGDTVANDSDNCPVIVNADQLDYDNDNIGYLCDSQVDLTKVIASSLTLCYNGTTCADVNPTDYPAAVYLTAVNGDADVANSDFEIFKNSGLNHNLEFVGCPEIYTPLGDENNYTPGEGFVSYNWIWQGGSNLFTVTKSKNPATDSKFSFWQTKDLGGGESCVTFEYKYPCDAGQNPPPTCLK